jgi:Holliday junction resolvase RusA-like endonuclease
MDRTPHHRNRPGGDRMTVRFFVSGVPVPQGSMRSFAHRRTGAIVTTHKSPQVLVWRDLIAHEAAKHCVTLMAGPVIVECDFFLRRPKSHFGTGRNAGTLKASAPTHVDRAPDVDKLVRACLDALTGVVFADDCQVVDLYATKAWTVSGEGVHVRVGQAGERLGGAS